MHEQAGPIFQGKASHEITEISFRTSVGTYLDSTFHRYNGTKDVIEIDMDDLILQSVAIDARNRGECEEVGVDVVLRGISLKSKTVLFNFGWGRYCGGEKYQSYRYISEEVIRQLVDDRAKLFGVDTINIYDSRKLYRPARSQYLEKEVLIVENLANLEKLYDNRFRLYAVPIKGKRVAAMPIGTFAETI